MNLEELYFSRGKGDIGGISFSDYLLLEGVKVINPKYGLNYPEFNDNKTKSITIFKHKSDYSTIIKINDIAFVIDLFVLNTKTPILMFRTKAEHIDDAEEILNNASINKRRNSKHIPFADFVFGLSQVISCAIDICNRHNISSFEFTGYELELSKLYNNIAKNKTFIKSLKDIGWESEIGNKFLLRKTNVNT